MPFLPFVLLLAWQAISKSASFALGWATSLYFGQVPGRQGRFLSLISLAAAGWVIVLIGFAIPLMAGAAADAAGLIPRNFSVAPVHALGLGAAIVGGPPLLAGLAVWAEFHEERSVGAWLRAIPASYPSTLSLGLAVLEMVVITPYLLIQRVRHDEVTLQVPLVLREEADDDDMLETITAAARSLELEPRDVGEASGPRAWPLRIVAYAVRHLLGAVVRGRPTRVMLGAIQVYAYATNISITGPAGEAYPIRAAIEREIAFANLYLTWSEDSQRLEDELSEVYSDGRDAAQRRDRLAEVQGRIDAAELGSEEWNLLYRLRLQLEVAARDGRKAVSGRR